MDKPPDVCYRNYKVCSLHFEKSLFKFKRLVWNAVPTIFSWSPQTDEDVKANDTDMYPKIESIWSCHKTDIKEENTLECDDEVEIVHDYLIHDISDFNEEYSEDSEEETSNDEINCLDFDNEYGNTLK